jgi:membrane protein YdbS with pleckstrin-like domain
VIVPQGVTLSRRAEKDGNKYLLPDETVRVAVRRHPAVLIEPTLKALPVYVVGGWLLLQGPENRPVSAVGLVVLVGVSIYYGLHVAEWYMRHFIVSARRVLLTSGVIVRTVTLLPLRRITDLTWRETLLGNLLGYGTFRFESAGQDQALRHLTFVRDAGKLYFEVSQLLFGRDFGGPGAAGDESGDDERDDPGPTGPDSPGRRVSDRHDTQPIPGAPPQQ